MVSESLTPGASVSKLVQRGGMNASLMFTWRRRAAGVSQTIGKAIELLPVKIADEPTPAPTSPLAGLMEIALVRGERTVVGPDVDAGVECRSVKTCKYIYNVVIWILLNVSLNVFKVIPINCGARLS